MKIILLQNVKNIGSKGQVKEVPDGYARNFLLAKKLAAPATQAAVEKAKLDEAKQKEMLQQQKLEMHKIAEAISGKEIVIKARAKDGKLFGSITNKEIAAEITKLGFKIPEKYIESDHIKIIGEHRVSIKLEHGIKTQVILKVEQA